MSKIKKLGLIGGFIATGVIGYVIGNLNRPATARPNQYELTIVNQRLNERNNPPYHAFQETRSTPSCDPLTILAPLAIWPFFRITKKNHS